MFSAKLSKPAGPKNSVVTNSFATTHTIIARMLSTNKQQVNLVVLITLFNIRLEISQMNSYS